MITANSVKSSGALAISAAAKGLTITAKPNTVLAELTKLSAIGTEIIEQSLPGGMADAADGDRSSAIVDDVATLLETSTNGSLDNPHPHSLYMDKVVEDISAVVCQHLGYAKNVVAPVVMEYAGNIQKALDAAKPRQANSDFDITVFDVPDLVNNPSFQDDLKYYFDKPVLPPDTLIEFGQKTRQEIFELIRTGDQELDELTMAWYTGINDDWLLTIWDSLFTKDLTNTNYPIYSPEMVFKKIEQASAGAQFDAGILLFLLGQRLFNAPGDVKDISLERYKDTMAQLRDYGGAVVVRSMTKMAAYENIKQIVLYFTPDQKGCTVYGPLYREWLKVGGSPEILLGMLLSGKQEVLFDVLLDQRETYLRAWMQYTAFFDTKQANEAFDVFRSILRIQFMSLMCHVSEDEKAFVDSHPEFSSTMEKVFTEEVARIRTGDMADIYGVALRIVCRARFYYTEAEMILSDIEQAVRSNPSIDVREAALVATMKYVNRYIAAQMTTSS